jgi:hypothetical protein|nr:MAG TPA: portal protein [Caudoviricetes sp.]
MDVMIRELLVKKPFVRMRAECVTNRPVSDISMQSVPQEMNLYDVYTQADFLREYYPSGHLIYNKDVYPDRYRQDPETKRIYKEEIIRCGFAFQQIIALRQTISLCGNDVQFTLNKENASESDNNNFYEFLRGWETHDMEVAWYLAARATKIVGDAALVGFMHNGKFRWKILSYIDGDTLYPHYDPETGKLSIFVRQYNDYDEDGKTITRWAEVWDDTYCYRFKESHAGLDGVVTKIKNKFGLDGYKLVSKVAHNFPFIPIAYIRTSGPCWEPAQETIEQFELAFSYMSQNNTAFALPILTLQGDDIEVNGAPMTDSIKVLTMGTDSKASYLNPPDGSNLFTMQLNKLYDLILEQCSVAKVPEVKSGDMPGIAVKLLFSPSIERAMEDSNLYKPFINGMVRIFKYGYGVEKKKVTIMSNLDISSYIEPYVHMNTSELVTNLATAVQNNFLSHETASERIRMYASAQEYDRIMREYKESQQMDIIEQLNSKSNNANPNED